MVYQYSYCVSGYYPRSCFYLKYTMFWRLESASVFRWDLLSWAQPIELVPISGHQQQHQIGYINQAEHKPSNWLFGICHKVWDVSVFIFLWCYFESWFSYVCVVLCVWFCTFCLPVFSQLFWSMLSYVYFWLLL
jgi:hypothetical protein